MLASAGSSLFGGLLKLGRYDRSLSQAGAQQQAQTQMQTQVQAQTQQAPAVLQQQQQAQLPLLPSKAPGAQGPLHPPAHTPLAAHTTVAPVHAQPQSALLLPDQQAQAHPPTLASRPAAAHTAPPTHAPPASQLHPALPEQPPHPPAAPTAAIHSADPVPARRAAPSQPPLQQQQQPSPIPPWGFNLPGRLHSCSRIAGAATAASTPCSPPGSSCHAAPLLPAFACTRDRAQEALSAVVLWRLPVQRGGHPLPQRPLSTPAHTPGTPGAPPAPPTQQRPPPAEVVLYAYTAGQAGTLRVLQMVQLAPDAAAGRTRCGPGEGPGDTGGQGLASVGAAREALGGVGVASGCCMQAVRTADLGSPLLSLVALHARAEGAHEAGGGWRHPLLLAGTHFKQVGGGQGWARTAYGDGESVCKLCPEPLQRG